ncbi:MAG: alpha-glucosidase [Lachnospiraceae bacterium]|nr:alpha-glucosidase [Lachnospiraceae bacterium]
MTGNDISNAASDDLLWWQKTNAYEIYVNSFQDSDGDGYGDLNGIRSKLDHLKSLGVGAVWLTPVYESPMMDNGYDVADYYAINPRYGTMEDMDALIKEADEKGIRVVMDLVFNHTSDQNEWFLASKKSRDNEYSDWYIWRDPKEGGSEPNNWRSIFGGSAWTWCEERQQYYLHTFASAQPDLNWENPDVRQALCDIANFWIEKGAGGFRMDAIPYIKKPADFSDGPVDDSEGRADIHKMTANTDGILDFLREFKTKVTEGKDVFTVGEANGVSPDQLKYWVGSEGVFDMIFEFSHVNLDFKESETWCKTGSWLLTDLKKALTDSQKATASNGWYPIYFENHDKPRSIDHFFPGNTDPVLAGKALGTVLLTLRGTPFIYQGEELGFTNVAWDSIDDYDDLNSHSQYEIALSEGFSEEEALDCVHRLSRDNARTPMQWDISDQAGFTTGTPWLPVHDDYMTENADIEGKDPSSVLSWYRKLSAIRGEKDVLINGTYEELLPESEEIYAFERKNENARIVILVNFTGEDVSYDPEKAGINKAAGEKILHSSYEDIKDSAPASIGNLRPYEAVLISK